MPLISCYLNDSNLVCDSAIALLKFSSSSIALTLDFSLISYSWDKMVSTFMTPLPASLRISFDCPYGDRLKAELQSYCGSAVEVNQASIFHLRVYTAPTYYYLSRPDSA